MALEIDHEGPEFPYLQLAAQLRRQIADGTLPAGRAIPSIERIQQETGLSPMTIRRAVRILAGEGLVVVVPGRGTFVAKGKPRQPGG